MATLGSGYLNLAQIAKMLAPDGSLLPIANILSRTTPIIEDLMMIEGNLPTGNRGSIRTGLPASTWRILYQGVQPTSGTVKSVTDTVAELVQLSQTDMSALSIENNKEGYLMKDAESHLISMGLDMEENFFYGAETDIDKFVGLTPRYNALSTDQNNTGFHVINAGGTGADNTSIWVICHGEGLLHGIYPKGSKAGLHKKNFDPCMITAPDETGQYYGIETLFTWKAGLAVPDWRAAVRICNIDVSLLEAAGTSSYTGPDLLNVLSKAMHKFPTEILKRATKKSIYCNREVITALDLIATNKGTGVALKDVQGEPVIFYRGVPVKMAEKIINTEALVS